jgi:FkbM family methyltransferase
MLKQFARNSAVKLFSLAARMRLHRVPLFDRAFLASYSIYKQYFEAGPIDGLKEFVPPGALVIDVGANVGFFTVRFADWVDRGRVIAIEPEEANYNNLLSTLRRAGLQERVQAVRAVAAEQRGTRFLELNPLHPADHKLSLDDTGIPTVAVTIDDLAHEQDGLTVTLIKIDVQGAELLVLRGAAEVLRTAHPALFIELHEKGLNKFGTSTPAVLDYLSGFGYVPNWLARDGIHRRTSLGEIQAMVARGGYVDVLFLADVVSR